MAARLEDWLASQTILITGATGFMGKFLLRLALERVAADRGRPIFVLLRPKPSTSVEQRLEKEIFNNALFSPLVAAVGLPALQNAVKAVQGDVGLPRLGLSNDDYARVTQEVNVIFHLAASINYREPIKRAIAYNVEGARAMLRLAKDCRQLKAFVHTSTCYVNSVLPEEEEALEKLYPFPYEPSKLLTDLEAMTDAQANAATPQLLGRYPNTYIFSKALAEHVLDAERGDLPLVVVRPSIVCGSFNSLLPGWVESLAGFSGFVASFLLGSMRAVQAKSEVRLPRFPLLLSPHSSAIPARSHRSHPRRLLDQFAHRCRVEGRSL